MFDTDKDGYEKILLQLEDGGFLERLTPYRFLRENGKLNLLGTGGTSYVYEMYDPDSENRRYAVKVITGEADPGSFERDRVVFRAQHAFSESSDNIARVFDLLAFKVLMDEEGNVRGINTETEEIFQTQDGLILRLLLMEKLESIIRKDRYGKAELLRTDLAHGSGIYEFAFQIGNALTAVHENGFLHRDIKLENIFWDDSAQKYKLGDFGVTRYVENGNADTVVFTDGYGAPEIERRLQTSYNVTADIYSFGITLYLLQNDLKFPGSDSYRASIVQYEKDFVFPAPAHAEPEMTRIIRKMCSYRSSDRYQSVREILTDLKNLCRDGLYTDDPLDEDYTDDLETETYRELKEETGGDEQGDGFPKGYYQIIGQTGNGHENYHRVIGQHEHESEDYHPENERDGRIVPDIEARFRKDKGINDESSVSWQDLTYEEKKKSLLRQKQESVFGMIVWTLLSAVFFAGIFCVFSPKPQYVGTWQLMVLPVMLIVLAILKQTGQLRLVFCMAVTCFLIYFMVVFGVDVPPVIMLLVVIACDPAVTFGCGIGTACWICCISTFDSQIIL